MGSNVIQSSGRPPQQRPLRRWSLLAALALAVSFGAGCGSESADSADSTAGNPITVTHRLGETVVTGTPKRIVALDAQWLDATLALGVTPVGYLDNISLITGGKRPPWEPESLPDAKALTTTGDLAEQLATLEPDLILASGFTTDQAQYDKLSRLAPTIPALSSMQVDRWTDQVRTVGKILGREGKATEVIDSVYRQIDDVARRHPGLPGKTYLTCWLAGPNQLMVLADPNDGAAEVFTRLGLRLPKHMVDEASSGGRLSLSPERLGDLDSDLLVATGEPLKQLPGYGTLPSVRKGSIVFIDLASGSGLNQPTALSLPYILKELEPALAKAAM
ncbi:ABC transporter substrate-binding protein [Nocardia sp. NPDC023852]|uniref:ABC transporter substrate-binding protein n=1 Tax=Nocardia sp. NPDC023852 TaxID=3154697 RepID=UPI0033F2B2AC